jgi:hypothetical protein
LVAEIVIRQLTRHSRESGNPFKNEKCQLYIKEKWIPAFAGMTEYYPQSDLGTIKWCQSPIITAFSTGLLVRSSQVIICIKNPSLTFGAWLWDLASNLIFFLTTKKYYVGRDKSAIKLKMR